MHARFPERLSAGRLRRCGRMWSCGLPSGCDHAAMPLAAGASVGTAMLDRWFRNPMNRCTLLGRILLAYRLGFLNAGSRDTLQVAERRQLLDSTAARCFGGGVLSNRRTTEALSGKSCYDLTAAGANAPAAVST